MRSSKTEQPNETLIINLFSLNWHVHRAPTIRKKNIMEPLDLISNYNIYYIFYSTPNTFTYISSFVMKNNYLEIKGIFIVLPRVSKLMNNIELGRIHCCFSRSKPIMPCKKLQEKLVWILLQIGSHVHFG